MKRRANGEGSIYQRKDGRWAASISLPRGTRKHFLGRTRTEVAVKLTEALKQRDDGLPVKLERQTVSSFLTTWLDTVRSSLKPRTWTRYEQLLRCHVLPAIGNMQLAKLGPQDLQALYSALLADGLAPATVRQVHAILHRSLKQATAWNLATRNPADAVTAPKPRREEMKVLAPEEARRLLSTAEGQPFEALFVLALSTGMRQGELLGLRWQNVDLDRGSVQVQSSLQRTREGFVLTEPKTRNARRSVVLTESAKTALRKHRVNQAAERLLVGPAWQDMNLVFPNSSGGPLEGSHLLRSRFYPLLAKAGLPRIRFHDLRHTAATLLLAKGIHPKIVSEMLGHSNIYITLDLYSHVTPTMQREAALAMESVLRP